ncbi:MAG: YtxH domain-containing protein [Flavobacteriaceae bacterium]|jgi:gas vesicle protein|nr:YtxH domain-containing protein [Flavobacteriaceae bacterium]
MSKNLGNTAIAILAGAVVGAGLGILFAPDEGKKTRRKIKRTFNETKDDLSDKIDDLKKQVRGVVQRKKHDVEADVEKLVHNAGKKREEVIAALEAKIAELKAQAGEVVEAAKK